MLKGNLLSLAKLAVLLAAGLFVAQRASAQVTPQSPRLAALAAQLAKGNSAAADKFWREVAEQGTPLVEPIEGDQEHVLVTFLFRGGEDVRNVMIFMDRGL